jgi:chromosome segregation protein
VRLLSLDLLRYGHLSDVGLRFPRDAALHVVLGANEAGKSTALAAIGDALFGFREGPQGMRFAFLHDGPKLRIGVEAEGRDGTRLKLVRRKGRKDTLLDAEERPVPEAALQRLTGGASRDLFERAFGLDGLRLRDGAKSLIEGGGEAGASLLAGMGLPHLRRAMDRLDRAADELHGDRRKLRRLAQAADGWQEAQRRLDAAAVRPAEWDEARDALARTEAEIRALAEEAKALAEEGARLQRLLRVRPVLLKLERLRADRAEVAAAPRLPGGAEATLARLRAAIDKAAEDARREEEAAGALAADLTALPRDPAALAEQDAVDALEPLRAAALTAARELPGLRRDALARREVVAAAAARLGLDATPETVRDALPKPAEREAARRQIRARTALLTTLAEKEEALAAALRRRARAEARLAEGAAPPPAAPLRRAVEAARAEGRLDEEIARGERALADAARRSAAALAALDPWAGDAAALGACRLPLPAAEAEAASRIEAAEAALAAARRAVEENAATAAMLAEEAAHLARGETVPTREVVAAARARRDAAWRGLRRLAEGGAVPEAAELPAFEALRDEADRLADARADDAQRVNDYAAKSARLDLLRARRPELEAAAERAAAELGAARAGWAALWAGCGFVPLAPAAMRQWRAGREKALELAEAEETARRRLEELAARRDAARAALATHLPEGVAAPLARMLAAAEEACAAAERAEAAHRDLAEAARREAVLAAEARDARDAAAAALAAAAPAWDAALAKLGLAPEAAVEELEAALSDWAAIAEAAGAWRGDAARAEALEADLAALGRAAGALAARLGEDGEGDAAVIAARLARRVKAAREAEAEARGLEGQIARRRRDAQAAREAGRAALAELARLHAAAGTADLAALEEAVRQAARRDALTAEIAREEAELATAGNGLAEAALREEAAGIAPDRVESRLGEIEARRHELGEQRTALGGKREGQRSALAALQAGRDAAGIAQDAHQHLADAQEAAERYARLHMARRLLGAAVERLRQERQGPMLRAAAANFRLLTGGRYTRLTTEEEDSGKVTLRAVRDDGTDCPMEALSEGTRDQLFLALRVAAVEAQAVVAEPLPFIADDLLATFDDGRATAALRLLARLGATVQPILFTHHAHIADLAAAIEGVHVQVLPGTAAALPELRAPVA